MAKKIQSFRQLKLNEFYALYANTPLNERFTMLNFNKFGTMTLSDFNKKIHEIDDIIFPLSLELDRLLRDIEPFLKKS